MPIGAITPAYLEVDREVLVETVNRRIGAMRTIMAATVDEQAKEELQDEITALEDFADSLVLRSESYVAVKLYEPPPLVEEQMTSFGGGMVC